MAPACDRHVGGNRLSQTITDHALWVRGIEALNRELGAAGALRFLTLLHREPTDSVEVSRRLYAGQTVDEIFDRAKAEWPKPR